MKRLLKKAAKSVLYRASDLLYSLLPRASVMRFYCYLTYTLRVITWRLACRFYGQDVIKYEGGVDEFVLSNISSGDRVLDVGCGDGVLTSMIADKAAYVAALDMNRRRIDGIDKSAEAFQRIRFIAADVSCVELDEVFDVAVMIHTIEHLERSREALGRLAKAARKIVIETPDQTSDWLYMLSRDLGIEDPGDETHVRSYDAGSLKGELEGSGWTDISLYKDYGVIRAVARSRLLR